MSATLVGPSGGNAVSFPVNTMIDVFWPDDPKTRGIESSSTKLRSASHGSL
jgi:hypothetical protein